MRQVHTEDPQMSVATEQNLVARAKYSVIQKDGLNFLSLYFKIISGDSNDKCSSSSEG
jgi:hypothetical protein